MIREINLLFLLYILSVQATRTQFIFTDSPLQKIGNRIYKQELLTNKFDDPKELAYDSSSRNLFFMYMDDELQNSGRAYINVLTKEADKIKGISRNKATAVDTETGDVYFGSEDGLYKYDPINKVAINIGLYNVNIMKLVVRNNEIYLIDANTHMIYRVFNKYRTVVKVVDFKTVMQLEVDNLKNIHFVTLCGLYCLTKDHEVIKNTDLSMVYDFILDEDKTLGVYKDGIYDINCANGTAKKITDLDFFPRSIIYGDYGDIFYSINNDIYRLKPISSYLVYDIIYKKRPSRSSVDDKS